MGLEWASRKRLLAVTICKVALLLKCFGAALLKGLKATALKGLGIGVVGRGWK